MNKTKRFLLSTQLDKRFLLKSIIRAKNKRTNKADEEDEGENFIHKKDEQ